MPNVKMLKPIGVGYCFRGHPMVFDRSVSSKRAKAELADSPLYDRGGYWRMVRL